MVQRWQMNGGRGATHSDHGKWIDYSDYLLLQAALREALEGWEEAEYILSPHGIPLDRIQELRKLLGDIRGYLI